MRTIILLFLLCGVLPGWSQSQRSDPPKPPLLNAAEVRVPGTYSSSAISGQVDNWQKLTQEAPGIPTAWFNYYLWTERDKSIEAKKKSKALATIVSDAKKHIRQSSEYSLIFYLQSGKKDSISLFNALSTATDKSWVYPYVIQYGIIRENESLLEKYCPYLKTSKPMSSGIYAYHYNVLMSADSNATIYGRGLHDIVPMAILQYAHDIRKDVHLRYYTDKINDQSNSYLCLSLGQEVLSQYPNAAYTGLLVKLIGSGSIDELKKHIEKDMDLGYMQRNDHWGEDVAQLYKNYLPSFILLYRHYRDDKNTEADQILTYIKKVAGRVGEDHHVNQLLEK